MVIKIEYCMLNRIRQAPCGTSRKFLLVRANEQIPIPINIDEDPMALCSLQRIIMRLILKRVSGTHWLLI